MCKSHKSLPSIIIIFHIQPCIFLIIFISQQTSSNCSKNIKQMPHPPTTQKKLLLPFLILSMIFLYYKFIIMQKTKAISKSELRANRRSSARDLYKETTFQNSSILEQYTILSVLNDAAAENYNDGRLSLLNFIQDLRSEQHFLYYSEDEMEETDSKKIRSIEDVNLQYRQKMKESQGRKAKSEKIVSFRQETCVRCFVLDDPPSEFWRYEENKKRSDEGEEEAEFLEE